MDGKEVDSSSSDLCRQLANIRGLVGAEPGENAESAVRTCMMRMAAVIRSGHTMNLRWLTAHLCVRAQTMIEWCQKLSAAVGCKGSDDEVLTKVLAELAEAKRMREEIEAIQKAMYGCERDEILDLLHTAFPPFNGADTCDLDAR